MAQLEKALTAKPNNPSSIPGTNMVERPNSFKLFSHLHTHMQINNVVKQKLSEA